MNERTVRVLDGNTFLVCQENGDVEPDQRFPTGLFCYDTRYLSTWRVTVDGERLQPLSFDTPTYYEARFLLVPGAPTHYVDATSSVIRHLAIGRSLVETITVINHERRAKDLVVRVEVTNDFADIFEIKDVRTTKKGRFYVRAGPGRLRLGYEREAFRRETLIAATGGRVDPDGLTFAIHLPPHGRWETTLSIEMLGADGRDIRCTMQGMRGPARVPLRHAHDEWLDRVPRLVTDRPSLEATYRRSLSDLAALRYTPLVAGGNTMPSAGLPWFMTIFGRDSILTSIQALPFEPKLAETTLRLLAAFQGRRLNDFREEEPGKIIHEIRFGESSAFEEQPHSPYFGSADSTPLFLVLLDEYERWTGDGTLVRQLEAYARAALNWIDEFGDLTGDGYVWYARRNLVNGLENQCWKDSGDAISLRDGRLAGFPRATCEIQGYAFDAKKRCARLAREFWNDPILADRLEREAADLRARFDRDFWVDDEGYYALALDGTGHRAEVLSSNIGHLLWSGIVDDKRAERVAEHLVGPRLFSGWGVRTLAVGEQRFNPVGYHVGTVWPFDNSFIALGLRRYGFAAEASRIAHGILDAAEFFHGRLPEAFAGFDRELTQFPVEYPTACSPQAWSTGTPLLLLRTMLGMEPQGDRLGVDPAFPEEFGGIELRDVPGRWGRTTASGRGHL